MPHPFAPSPPQAASSADRTSWERTPSTFPCPSNINTVCNDRVFLRRPFRTGRFPSARSPSFPADRGACSATTPLAISRFRRRLVHNAADHRFPENGAPHLRKAPFFHLGKLRSRRIPAHVRKRDAGASPPTLRTFSGVTISPYCRHHGFMILMLNTQRGQVPSGRDISCSLQVLRCRRSAHSGKKVRLQNTTAGPA